MQRDEQAFLKRAATHRWRPYDLVFATSLGTPIDSSNSYHRLQKLLRAAGLPKAGFHELRHSCASLLLAGGVPMRAVMELLGHSQMSLTGDLYSHVSPQMLEENAAAFERIMGGS
jgi:integrase